MTQVRLFTCREARSGPIVGLFAFLLLLEAAVLHLLLHRIVPWLAYTLSAGSLASVLWLIADYRAMGGGGVTLSDQDLRVAVGRRLEADIARREIASVSRPTWQDLTGSGSRPLNATKPAQANILIAFRSPQPVTLFGAVERPISRLALHLDDPDGFCTAANRPPS